MSLRQNSDAPSPPEVSSSSPVPPQVSPRVKINSAASPAERPVEQPAEQLASTAISRSLRRVPSAAYAVVPSVLFLSLGLATRNNTLSPPTSSTRSGSALQVQGRNAILSASQTMIVPATTASPAVSPGAPATSPGAPATSSAAGSVIWRARLQPVVDVVGRAPIAGQITRVWARPGQSVSVGDRVLRILSYNKESVEVAPRRRTDSAAEEEQVQAVRAQSDLGTRLSQAQARLKAAQDRVARAQSRVNDAMTVVRKLQNGASTESDIEGSNSQQTPPKPASGMSAVEVQAAQATAERAGQAAQNARDEAIAAEREAERAESEAQDKTRRARELRQAREAARTAISDSAKTSGTTTEATSNNVPPATKAPAAKPDVPGVSAGAVSDADSAAREASSRAASLRKKANGAKSVADKAESRAAQASSRAKSLLRSLQLFSEETSAKSASTRRKTSTRASQKLPSVEEAARMVSEATSESRAASRDANRWKSEVDAYSRQARQTQQRLAASEQNLGSSQQQAQQQELETTIQRNLSVVRAPANGTILQIGDVGDSVSFGDAILMVGKAGVLRAQFSDTSGLWRKLKRGAMLPATVSMRSDASKNAGTSTRSSTSDASSGVSKAGASSGNAISVLARVEEVEKPTKKGAPALVKTTVRTLVSAAMKPTDFKSAPNTSATTNDVTSTNASDTATRLRAGMVISCSVDGASLSANDTANIDVDNAAKGVVLPKQAVVTLEGESSTRASTRDGDDAFIAAESAARAYVAVLLPDENGDFGIEWREVQVQPTTSSEQRLVQGLVAGERVALFADSLRELTLNYGKNAKVSLRDNA